MSSDYKDLRDMGRAFRVRGEEMSTDFVEVLRYMD